MTETVKYLLDETHSPKCWNKFAADLPVTAPPLLHPGRPQPVGHFD